MSTITATTATTTETATQGRAPSWRFGVTTTAVAAAVTTVLVVTLRAAGVPFQVEGEEIPVLGFAQMVLLGGVIGIVLARRTSRTTFVRATVVLTAASCIPSVALGTGVGSKLALVLTHLVAAAIIVPQLAKHQRH